MKIKDNNRLSFWKAEDCMVNKALIRKSYRQRVKLDLNIRIKPEWLQSFNVCFKLMTDSFITAYYVLTYKNDNETNCKVYQE